MKDFKILDCTLRDGSYVNHFQFGVHETRYVCSELEKCGIEYIEVGHGLGLGAYRLGGEYAAAATDEEYLGAAAEAVKKSVFGTFCIPDIAKLEDIDTASKYGMKLIRIGTNVDAVESSRPFVERAKKYGMTVCANYMKSYSASPEDFVKKVRLSKSYGVDIIYLVDSAGGMLPKQVESYIRTVRDSVDMKIGFHGHNNLGLALANSLVALDMGAYFIDCSMQGLGRSGGNAATEQFVIIMSKLGNSHGIDIFRLMDLGFNTIQPLLQQTGLNPIDIISGYAMFHSSYMPLIRKFSLKHDVDPRLLIIELCKIDQVNADPVLIEKIAAGLPKIKADFISGKYHLDRYFVNEQQVK